MIFMKELINSILECILDARKIPEEMLYQFSKTTTKIVQSGCTEVIPKSFGSLRAMCRHFGEEKNT